MSFSCFSTEALLDMPIPLPVDASVWLKDTPYLVGSPSVAVVIEYLPGSIRRKVRDNGQEVTNVMPAGYGRISRTTDIHGEDLDMYLNAKGYTEDAPVFIIDQVGLTGMFDEHKVMFGFPTVKDATDTYLSVVKPGIAPVKIGAVTQMSQEQFHQWIARPDKTMSPASFDTELGKIVVSKVQILTKASATPTVMDTKSTPVPGGVEITLGNIEDGPYFKTSPNGDTGLHHTCHIYGAITYKTWWKFLDQIVRLLDTATSADKFTFLISSPGGSVPTVGPLLSAMKRTKGNTETIATGPVASAAVFIWALGRRRVIHPNSYFMEHSTFQVISGKTKYINALTGFTEQYARKLIGLLQEVGMFTEDEVEGMFEHSADVFLTAAEMIARVGEVSGEGVGA